MGKSERFDFIVNDVNSTITYFFVEPEHISGDNIIFPPNEEAHLSSVMKKRCQDAVTVTDGIGNVYEVILDNESTPLSGRIISRRKETIGRIKLTLAVGIGRKERMEWLVEKATELGVFEIQPLMTEQSNKQRTKYDFTAQLKRWQRIAIAAIKQSRRSYLPELKFPISLKELLASNLTNYNYRIGFDIEAAEDRAMVNLNAISLPAAVLILIGPESGFSESEKLSIKQSGFELLSLGRKPLRFETASVAALVLVHTLFKNWE